MSTHWLKISTRNGLFLHKFGDCGARTKLVVYCLRHSCVQCSFLLAWSPLSLRFPFWANVAGTSFGAGWTCHTSGLGGGGFLQICRHPPRSPARHVGRALGTPCSRLCFLVPEIFVHRDVQISGCLGLTEQKIVWLLPVEHFWISIEISHSSIAMSRCVDQFRFVQFCVIGRGS